MEKRFKENNLIKDKELFAILEDYNTLMSSIILVPIESILEKSGKSID